MQENIGNAEIENLSNLLIEAQDLLKQYESMHEQIMQQVDQQKESITLHEQNFSQSRVSFEQEEQLNDQQISSALQQINTLLRDPDVSPMRQVSSQITQNASNISTQSNIQAKQSKISSCSINDGQNFVRSETFLNNVDENIEEAEEFQEEEKPLMTQLNPNQLPPIAPKKAFSDLSQAQELIVNSVLDDNYFQKVKGAYSMMEFQEVDNSLTEKLTSYGDERMSELQSIVSSKSVILQKPRLSQNVGHLFDSLYKGSTEVLELEIPQIKQQPDFLREQIQESKLNKYMSAIESCLKLVNNQINLPSRDELENLLIQAELHTVGENLLNEDQVEALCADIEAEHSGHNKTEDQAQNQQKQGEQSMASVLDSFMAAETRQSEKIEEDLRRYTVQQEQEELMRREATATTELSKVIEIANELLGDQQPQRRTGSAKAILDKSQTRLQNFTGKVGKSGQKQRIRTPKLLDGIKK